MRNLLLHDQEVKWDVENELLRELSRLARLPHLSRASAIKFRYYTKRKCIASGQLDQNFSDNNQHDAGEFFSSVLYHLFEDSVALKILMNRCLVAYGRLRCDVLAEN